jgi:hypothetical protein
VGVDESRWRAVDEYLAGKLAPADEALTAALEANRRAAIEPARDAAYYRQCGATGGRDRSVGSDPDVQGIRKLMDVLAGERRVAASAIQTVGVKGHDGFAVAVVL